MPSTDFLKSLTCNRTKELLWPSLYHANHLRTPTYPDVHVLLRKYMEYCTVVVRMMLNLDILTYAFSVFYLMPFKPISSTLIGNALPPLTLKRHTRMTLWASASPMIILKSKKKTEGSTKMIGLGFLFRSTRVCPRSHRGHSSKIHQPCRKLHWK